MNNFHSSTKTHRKVLTVNERALALAAEAVPVAVHLKEEWHDTAHKATAGHVAPLHARGPGRELAAATRPRGDKLALREALVSGVKIEGICGCRRRLGGGAGADGGTPILVGLLSGCSRVAHEDLVI